jgi:integrase
MARGRVTKEAVEAIQPGECDAYLWDDALAGFGFKVTPAGRRVYLIQYRLGGRKGRTRRVTLGVHGIITPYQARVQAKQLLGEVHAGRDPAASRDHRKQTETVERALERFFAGHIAIKLKASTAREYRRLVRLHLPPAWRGRLLTDIGPGDIARLHAAMADRRFAANRMTALLSKFFNWCDAHGLLPGHANPCRHVERFREKGRERFLTPDELRRLGAALSDAERRNAVSPWSLAAIHLLLFTGARLGEIRTLRWEHVDLAGQQLRLPESKTGKKSIYLNAPALEVLRACRVSRAIRS